MFTIFREVLKYIDVVNGNTMSVRTEIAALADRRQSVVTDIIINTSKCLWLHANDLVFDLS